MNPPGPWICRDCFNVPGAPDEVLADMGYRRPPEGATCAECGARALGRARASADAPLDALFDPSPPMPVSSLMLRELHLHQFTEGDLTEPVPPVMWKWKPRIAVGKVHLLGGAGGTLKSSLTVGLAVHGALGRPFLGHLVKQGGTLFVTAEDDFLDYRRKMQAWTRMMPNLDEEAVKLIAHHVRILDMVGHSVPFVRRERGGTYTIDRFVDAVAELLVCSVLDGVDLVVIETASRFGADETNEGARELINACEIVAARGRAVILVGHVTKTSARDGYNGQHAFRGASAFSDNARGELVLAKLDPGDAPNHGISSECADSYLVLTTAKSHPAVRRPPPLVLEKVSPPVDELGGVLRLHERDSSPEGVAAEVAVRRAARERTGCKLRALVADLIAQGTRVTRNTLRDHARALGLSRDRLPDAVTDAIRDGFLGEARATGRGGGTTLVPGPKSPEVAGADSSITGDPSPNSTESPEAIGRTTSAASSKFEGAEVAGSRRDQENGTPATSGPQPEASP